MAALGKKPKQEVLPDGPPFPDDLDYLFAWFQEVSAGISSNGMGPAIVTWRDVRAWRGEMLVVLEPWEARVMVRLGVLRANIQAEKMEKEAKTRTAASRSKK